MLRRLLIAIGLALWCTAPASAASDTAGPSFDCAKAASEIERTICGDPQLAAADRTMAALFTALSTSAFGEGPSNFIKSQREWLKDRAMCVPLNRKVYSSVAECLLASYKSRNIALAQSATFAAPEVSQAVLAKHAPDLARIQQALALYVADSGRKDEIAGLLTPSFDHFMKEGAYGRDILADMEITKLDDMLASDNNFGLGLKMLGVYGVQDGEGALIPCTAVVRSPGLMSAIGPIFGSSLDSAVPYTDCSEALPALPKLDALDAAVWANWPMCEGTIRFSSYRSYSEGVDGVRLGLVADGSSYSKYLKLPVDGVKAQLVTETVAELTAYYRSWLKDDPETADWRARNALGNMLNLAHECGG